MKKVEEKEVRTCSDIEEGECLIKKDDDRIIKNEWNLKGWTIREFENRNYIELEKDGKLIRVGDKTSLKWVWYWDPNFNKSALVIIDKDHEEEILKDYIKEGEYIFRKECLDCPKYYQFLFEQI